MLYPFTAIQKSAIQYIPRLKSSSHFLYLFILSGILAALACLPFIYTDISVKTSGIIRPSNERTEVRSVITGIIDTILYKEGDNIQKHAVILRIKDLTTQSKRTRNQFETRQCEQFIHDLGLLTSDAGISSIVIQQLISPLYKEQASRFMHQKTDQEASLKKANKELEINIPLARDKVISSKEFFDIQVNGEKTLSAYKAFLQEQLSIWQQDLAKYRLELSQYRQQTDQLNTEAGYYEVKASVAGVIQGIDTWYTGGSLQANETLCTISPEEKLVGECYVPTKDIGLLKKGQAVRYRFEAFDYNYFGVLTGRIINIDNDFTTINNKPVFKVRCSFDSAQLHLKNGYTGQLKKGLGFQACFVVTRRSLWQLLFDKMDDWLNPNAPVKQTPHPIE
jgi:multidrug resistance efflux pump